MIQKVRDNLLLVAQLVTLICTVVVLSHAQTIQQLSYNTPVVAEPITPTLDSEQLFQKVKSEIDAITNVKDGVNGRNGTNGLNGQNGSVDYGQVRQIVQEEVAKVPVPKDGLNGLNGESAAPIMPEIHYNPVTNNLEWRIQGDDSWQILVRMCQVTGTCNG